MAHDTPPTDNEVLSALDAVDGGLKPTQLLQALRAADYEDEDIIRAIQRVFDRGLVELGDGAKLVRAEELAILAA